MLTANLGLVLKIDEDERHARLSTGADGDKTVNIFFKFDENFSASENVAEFNCGLDLGTSSIEIFGEYYVKGFSRGGASVIAVLPFVDGSEKFEISAKINDVAKYRIFVLFEQENVHIGNEFEANGKQVNQGHQCLKLYDFLNLRILNCKLSQYHDDLI